MDIQELLAITRRSGKIGAYSREYKVQNEMDRVKKLDDRFSEKIMPPVESKLCGEAICRAND